MRPRTSDCPDCGTGLDGGLCVDCGTTFVVGDRDGRQRADDAE